MSQDWASDLYTTATEANTTLSNMELMFATLKSLFSGTSAPSNTVAGMPWFDTTKKIMKQRNQGDSAWIGLMHGDASQKVWVYRNAAMDGWAIDSSVSDKVLGLKGGTTYTTGAATAGSWTVSGIPTHNHKFYIENGADDSDQIYDASGVATDVTTALKNGGIYSFIAGTGGYHPQNAWTSNATLTQDGTWRAAAAVGTLQYLDL